ncbi:MAG: hypothetical protein RIC55_15445 [Pirellulaceae bacterium]
MNDDSRTTSIDESASPGDATQLWLNRALWLALLLAGGLSLSSSLTDPDLWGHVQYGRDLLRDGVPAVTTYSYAVDDYRWINHENLAEITFAVVVDTLGPEALLLAKLLLGMGMLALMMRHAQRQGTPLIVAGGVALLVATNISFHWSVRPQLFSYMYFTLLTALLAWCFQGWEGSWHLRFRRAAASETGASIVYSSRRMRYLWLAPVIFFFWANSHGGFAAGFCVFVAYLALRSIEALLTTGPKSLGLLARFALMIAAAAAATLLNPYGPRLHLWLLQSLGAPRPEIIEWWPPELLTANALTLWMMMGLWAAGLMFSRRSRDFTQAMLMTITLWQSLEHQRHIPFFAILFGFWMPPHIASLIGRLRLTSDTRPNAQDLAPYMKWVLAGGFAVAFALLGFKYYDRLRDLRVEKDIYPVAAVEYIAEHDLTGKMVVTYNWAQYIIAAFGPRGPGDDGILVGFDGRFRTCYPQEVVDINFDLLLGDPPNLRWRGPSSPPFDGGHRVLEYRQPDLVLISRFQEHSGYVVEQHRDEWVLLYQDELAQLWGRKSRYDDPTSADYIPLAERDISDAPQEGFASWPAIPPRRSNVGRVASDR